MLSKWQILKKILEAKISLTIQELQKLKLTESILGDFAHTKNNQFFAFLKEDDPSSKMSNVWLTRIPTNSILLSPDVDITHPWFLQKNDNMRKRCDYILLTKLNGKDVVVFLELKSQNYKLCEVECQFKGGDCLLEYFVAISKNFQNTSISFNFVGIQRRYVILYVPDKPSKFSKYMPIPSRENNSPQQPFEYPVITGGKQFPLLLNINKLVKI